MNDWDDTIVIAASAKKATNDRSNLGGGRSAWIGYTETSDRGNGVVIVASISRGQATTAQAGGGKRMNRRQTN